MADDIDVADTDDTQWDYQVSSALSGWNMPPKVAAAIAKVMHGIKTLEKDESNKHASYKYAGIESFLELVRPLCAANGLIVVQDEEHYEFREAPGKEGRPIMWLVMVFTFTLIHESGETWHHRPKRTAMVQASMGSQSFGAAQSYALKSFMRSLFQIATGETEDADNHPQAELPARHKTEPKSAPQAISYTPEESTRYVEVMVAQIAELPSVEEVADYAKAHAATYQRCQKQDQQKISKALSDRKAALTPKEQT